MGNFSRCPSATARNSNNIRSRSARKRTSPTPIGKLRALHLRKMHTQGEAYFEIWLGLEYRLLPVKFHQVDSSGKVTEESVISGIRAADK